MPNHVHFFVRGNPDFVLSSWVGGLKRAMSVAGLNQSHAIRLPMQRKSLWQPGVFDHVLRNDESYAQKWEYVRENPVRGGLVAQWHEWPYQGEIALIDHVPAASLARDTRATTEGKRRFALIRLSRWSTAKAGNPRFFVPLLGYFC